MHLQRAFGGAIALATAIAPVQAAPELGIKKSLGYRSSTNNISEQCAALATAISNSTVDILIAEVVSANSNISVVTGQEVCPESSYTTTVDMCRIAANISTTSRSFVSAEFWLPIGQGGNGTTDIAWNGRLIATGNAVLGGCILYTDLQYLSSLGFATVGDNAGHDGLQAEQLLNNNDRVLDWSWRARYTATLLGQQIVSTFYHKASFYSYYFGCSTAGRQALKAVQDYPQLFQGVIAGAPANDLNHLTDWSASFYLITGNSSDARFVTEAQWTVVHEEILAQCDLIDGVQDYILEDPTLCDFDSSTLLCDTGNSSYINDTTCLTSLQQQTVSKIYEPLRLWGNGTLLFPGLTLSSELDAWDSLDGSTDTPGTPWFMYAVMNNASFDVTTITNETFIYSDSLDPYHGFVSSYNGNLTSFRDLGGKLIMYQGLADSVIAGTNAMRYYEHVASTMSASPAELDPWFRYFRVSSMGHCSGGDGAWAFGQSTAAEDASDNIIWDIVAWVEEGTAPEVLVGTKWVDDTPSGGVEFERAHCRYPYRTTYIGGNPNVTTSWDCKFIDNWKAYFPEEDFGSSCEWCEW